MNNFGCNLEKLEIFKKDNPKKLWALYTKKRNFFFV